MGFQQSPPTWQRRTIHDENILTEIRHGAATGGGLCDFVIRQIDAANVGWVAVKRIPLPVNDCVRNARVAASEGRTPVIRAGGTKVCERQVGKVEMPCRVHASFGITAAEASGDFPFKSGGVDDPHESLAAIERVPKPASVGGKRAGRASVETVRIRRI